MAEEQVEAIIEVMADLLDDNTVPRNIKGKIQSIIQTLREKNELSIRVNKVLNELDEVTNDVNLQPYTRTQLYNIGSMLEKVA